jgi:hypothetical protein
MPEIVNCDVCGGMYNQRYLSAHKRLSHGGRPKRGMPKINEPKALKAIFSMYAKLSEENKKKVLERLTTYA